jgi:hypothetical protein
LKQPNPEIMPNPTSKGQSPDLVIRSFDKSSMMLVKELKFESVVKPLFRTTPLYCWNKDSYSAVRLMHLGKIALQGGS